MRFGIRYERQADGDLFGDFNSSTVRRNGTSVETRRERERKEAININKRGNSYYCRQTQWWDDTKLKETSCCAGLYRRATRHINNRYSFDEEEPSCLMRLCVVGLIDAPLIFHLKFKFEATPSPKIATSYQRSDLCASCLFNLLNVIRMPPEYTFMMMWMIHSLICFRSIFIRWWSHSSMPKNLWVVDSIKWKWRIDIFISDLIGRIFCNIT